MSRTLRHHRGRLRRLHRDRRRAGVPSRPPEVGYSSEDEFKADIAAKHEAGKSVVLSVGGELGNVTVADSASAQKFADSAYALMREYGFDGVDIDLEHGLNAPPYMGEALKSLSEKAGDGFVLTMAPQTLDMQSTGTEYFKLALDVKDILTVVNTQYYNSGSMLGCDARSTHRARSTS